MNHETYMRRALELATLGRGHVSPNPMVGCVIVHDATGRVLGEGWHQRYGEAHAERNAIAAVSPHDAPLLTEATAYVTLEPCSHWGKTPPCANLLIERQLRRVVCCNFDPNPLVAGQGFRKLREAGIDVVTDVLVAEGRGLNARFFRFFEQRRPYVVLKWAQTADGFIGAEGGRPAPISGPLSRRLVHRWRAEEAAILVGTNTARSDNPRLNVRDWPAGFGRQPLRITIDRILSLPTHLHLFDGSQPTLVYTHVPNVVAHGHATAVPLAPDAPLLPQLLADLHERRVQSVLVEGGTATLQAFLDAGLWDEMRVFQSPRLLHRGVAAPTLAGNVVEQERVGVDTLLTLRNPAVAP